MRLALDDSRGHTMIELMVACSLLLVIMGALAALAIPADEAFRMQPELADLQQRLRIVADALHRDLAAAGAGFTVGPGAGPLTRHAPAVLPYRAGAAGAGVDAPGSFRPDAITVLSVSSVAAQCLTDQPLASPLSAVPLRLAPGCPMNDPVCGFEPGMRALVADGSGNWDPFTVSGLQLASGQLEHASDAFSTTYAAGSSVAALQIHAYSLRDDPSTGTPQLMRSDGAQSDLPMCDHVVGLEFEYFGSAAPPELVWPSTEPIGPWTSYGPRPPPIGVIDGQSTWPAGENCIFRVEDGRQLSRLETLAGGVDAVVRLDPSMLTDGPWCPHPTAPNRFDGDLLRVRKVRVSIRVQAGSPAVRGGAGAWFVRPGSAIGAGRLVPDQVVTFDVAPRNLSREPPS
jgi:hypothetical protein